MDVMTPKKIVDFTNEVIEENKDFECLQIVINVPVEGDYLEIPHDWGEKDRRFTILDVNINPLMGGRTIEIEKVEINEYLEKSGLGKDSELSELCRDMFERYSRI